MSAAAIKALLTTMLIVEAASQMQIHSQRQPRTRPHQDLLESAIQTLIGSTDSGICHRIFGGCCDTTLTSCYIEPEDCYCDLPCFLYGDCCPNVPCPSPGKSTCTDLGSLDNGMITYTPYTNAKRPGTIAFHSCNEGYALVGNPMRVCRHDLTWGGSSPQCNKSCPVLNALDNGNIIYKPPNSSPQKPVRTVAIAKCNPGYSLEFEDDEQRVCRESGSTAAWSGHDATCTVHSCMIQYAETGGCCSSTSDTHCIVGPQREHCLCSVECFKNEHISIKCCPDIGCIPRNCTEANMDNGCCNWDSTSGAGCYVCGGGCYCDQECHAMRDCCPDVTKESCSDSAAELVLTDQRARTGPHSRVQIESNPREKQNQKSQSIRELASELRSMNWAQELSNKQQTAQWQNILAELQKLQKAKIK